MRHGSLVLTCALMLSCADRTESGFLLLGVSPNQGDDDAPVSLTIFGEGFVPRVRADFSEPAQSAIDDRFRVSLVASGGVEQALNGVGRQSEQVLTALVPAGLSRGYYSVRVTDPSGATALLPEVYRSVRSAGHLAGFQIEPIQNQHLDVPFMVAVTAVDSSGEIVDGYSGSPLISDRTESLSAQWLAPFTLGRALTEITINALSASDAIQVSDGEGHVGASNEFAVEPGLAVQLAFAREAQSLEAGVCSDQVVLQVRDRFSEPAMIEAAMEIRLSAAPPEGIGFFSDELCSDPVDAVWMEAGGSDAPFYFVAEKAGTVVIQAGPEVLPSTSQPQSIHAQPPSRLDFSVASADLGLGGCSPPLVLTTFDAFGNVSLLAETLTVLLAVQPANAVSFYSDESCSSPVASIALMPDPAGAAFYVRGDAAGTVSLSASAPGAPSLVPGVLVLRVTP